MVFTLHDFHADSAECVRQFNAFAAKHSLSGYALPDHICYKCGSAESFERVRKLFESESEYIFQSIISARRISYIKFKKPLVSGLGPIAFLELSDQKPDGSQGDGFDHIEVYPVAMPYEDFVRRFENAERVIKVERPHHATYDIEIGGGFIFRCTREPLIEKIKRSEMV